MSIWNVFAFDEDLDPARLAGDCARWGVDRVVLSPSHVRDRRLPAQLRAHGVGLWLNLPIFHAPAVLERYPKHYALTWRGERAVEDWLHMACPTDEAFLDGRVAEFTGLLRRVEPDALSLDFIRCFVRWESVAAGADPASVVDGCYCRRCLLAFARFAAEPVRRDAEGRLVREQWPAWADWRTARITEAAERFTTLVRDEAPGVALCIHTVPWGPLELDDGLRRIAGQDIDALGRMSDHLVPMALTHLLGRDAAWKRAHLDEVRRRTGKEVLSYVQIESISGGSIPPARVAAEIEAALAERRDLAVFAYEQLAADPTRAALLRRYTSAGR